MEKKTFHMNPEKVERKWYIIDAAGKVLGRLSTKAALLLQGKHKPYFSRDVDCGDFVVVTNAGKIKLTGKKLDTMFDFKHSGYPGNVKIVYYKNLIKTNPERIIELAVKGMLPKNKLRAKFLKRLKIYKEGKHPNEAQKPVSIEI